MFKDGVSTMSLRCAFGFHKFRTGKYNVDLTKGFTLYAVAPICRRCHVPDSENMVIVRWVG